MRPPPEITKKLSDTLPDAVNNKGVIPGDTVKWFTLHEVQRKQVETLCISVRIIPFQLCKHMHIRDLKMAVR
jgi:hypothetical protein